MNQKLLWKIESLWKQYFSIKDSELPVFAKTIKDSFLKKKESFGFHVKDKFNFASGDIVFEDAYGSYRGLAESQVIEHKGKLIYLCDNHNKILVPLFHLYLALNEPLSIVHIDAHRDDAAYEQEKPTIFNAASLGQLLTTSRISDFFDALSETGVVASVQRITDSQSFVDYKPEKKHLLSLDIDIFGPEGDFVGVEEKVKVIAEAWQQADIVCIAMSPGFIDQEFAQNIINLFN